MFRKGAHAAAYSGFEGVDDEGTPLADWLRAHDVDAVDVVGSPPTTACAPRPPTPPRTASATRVLLGLTAGVAPGTTAEAITALGDTGVDVAPA